MRQKIEKTRNSVSKSQQQITAFRFTYAIQYENLNKIE